MSHMTVPPGFHPIRHDRLLQEKAYDAYQTRGELPEPTVCSQCHAVFHEGHWRWREIPKKAHREPCPACHRASDRYPAGFVRLQGPFFQAHRAEIMSLILHEEQRERLAHPLKRIMEVEEQRDAVVITTTDIHLARTFGEAVHHAYQGELEFHYNPEEALLRVHWSRENSEQI